jgi:hypothetical protein
LWMIYCQTARNQFDIVDECFPEFHPIGMLFSY